MSLSALVSGIDASSQVIGACDSTACARRPKEPYRAASNWLSAMDRARGHRSRAPERSRIHDQNRCDSPRSRQLRARRCSESRSFEQPDVRIERECHRCGNAAVLHRCAHRTRVNDLQVMYSDNAAAGNHCISPRNRSACRFRVRCAMERKRADNGHCRCNGCSGD